jgi:predicted outer membrane repeat protein
MLHPQGRCTLARCKSESTAAPRAPRRHRHPSGPPRGAALPLLLVLSLLPALQMIWPRWGGGAFARTFTVRLDGTGGVPTFQAAIDSAESGDEIVVEPGTYTWENQGSGTGHGLIEFPRDKIGMWVHSAGGPAVTILDAQHRGRVMFINGINDSTLRVSLTVEGFTIRNGVAPTDPEAGYGWGGGVWGHLADSTLRDCIFLGNSGVNGGAIWWGGVSAITLEDCVFRDNHAEFGGGMMIINSYKTATLRRCTFTGNTASNYGGGLYCVHDAFALYDCVFTGNQAIWLGGGLCCNTIRPSTAGRLTVAWNSSADGSGIYGRTHPDLGLTSDLTIERGLIAFNFGGPAVTQDPLSQLTLSCTDLYGNRGGDWKGSIASQAGQAGNLSVDPLFCPGAGGDPGLCAASPCLPQNNACAATLGARGQGCDACTAEVANQQIVLHPSLHNPYRPFFHSGALLPFSLAQPGFVELRAFDLRGRSLRTILAAAQEAGDHLAVWDGRDADGRFVPSGVYVLRLQTGGLQQTQKLVIVR